MTSSMMLYGLLSALHQSFVTSHTSFPGSNLLIVLSKHESLPLSYWQKLANNPDIKVVCPVSSSAFYYQFPRNTVYVGIVDPQSYLKLFPDLKLVEAQKLAWLTDKTGAIVSESLAENFHWQVGSVIPLLPSSSTFHSPLYVKVDGIIPSSENNKIIIGQLLIHLEYYKHWLPPDFGNFVVYAVSIKSTSNPTVVSQSIDYYFRNYPYPTTTQPYDILMQQWVNRIGNVSVYSIIAIAICVISIGLAIATAVVQEVHQRLYDYALMLALGFTKQNIIFLLFIEHAFLMMVGFTLGMIIAVIATHFIHPEMLPYFYTDLHSVIIGGCIAIATLFFTLMVPILALLKLQPKAALRGM